MITISTPWVARSHRISNLTLVVKPILKVRVVGRKNSLNSTRNPNYKWSRLNINSNLNNKVKAKLTIPNK